MTTLQLFCNGITKSYLKVMLFKRRKI